MNSDFFFVQIQNIFTQCTLLLSVDHLRVGPPQQKVSKTSKPKVFVTNGRDTPLRGEALVFTKVAEADVTITETNIMKVAQEFTKL